MLVKIKRMSGGFLMRAGECWYRDWGYGLTTEEEAHIFDTEDPHFAIYFRKFFNKEYERVVYVWVPPPVFNAAIEGARYVEDIDFSTPVTVDGWDYNK